MNDYQEELREVIQEKLYSYVSDLEEIKIRPVRNIEWLQVMSIMGLPEKASKLFSGKEFLITPRGSFRFMQKTPNGAHGVTMKFWALDMKVTFDNENEEFVVEELGDFGAFD